MKKTDDAHESEADVAADTPAAMEAEAEAEKVSPEAEHLRRLQVLRHVRDEALVASRQLDVHRLAQAVHDFAHLQHEMLEDAGVPKTK